MTPRRALFVIVAGIIAGVVTSMHHMPWYDALGAGLVLGVLASYIEQRWKPRK